MHVHVQGNYIEFRDTVKNCILSSGYIFAVLVTVVLGLVHKPSTFSPMANLFPGFSSLQQVQLHSGRNCLNLFQTTAEADPVVPRALKDWEQYVKFKNRYFQVNHPPKIK